MTSAAIAWAHRDEHDATESAAAFSSALDVQVRRRDHIRGLLRFIEFKAKISNPALLVGSELVSYAALRAIERDQSALSNEYLEDYDISLLVVQANQFMRRPARIGRPINGANDSDTYAEIENELEATTKTLQVRRGYALRINDLRVAAELDGFAIPPRSENDFWKFINETPLWRQGNLVLRPNGNLRLVWIGHGDNHVGIEFSGNQQVQYVIFKDYLDDRDVKRIADLDTFEGIKATIESLSLTPM